MELSLVEDIISMNPLENSADKALLRDKISMLERAMKQGPQIEVPLKHTFSKNVYAREITIPKGSIIIGKIHKHQNMNIISKGEVSFFSIDGAVRVKAPYTFVASPGVKRVIVAHEETVWTTIHGTSETDLDKLEDEFIAKDYSDFYLSTSRSLDDVLEILGFTSSDLTAISENELDQIPFPKKIDSIAIADSPIHGKGLFAVDAIKKDCLIAPAVIGGKRTPAGRYTNHGKPNAKMVINDGNIFLISERDIEVGEEILTDYYLNHINTRELVCHG